MSSYITTIKTVNHLVRYGSDQVQVRLVPQGEIASLTARETELGEDGTREPTSETTVLLQVDQMRDLARALLAAADLSEMVQDERTGQ